MNSELNFDSECVSTANSVHRHDWLASERCFAFERCIQRVTLVEPVDANRKALGCASYRCAVYRNAWVAHTNCFKLQRIQ